jgi:hypothetical protein
VWIKSRRPYIWDDNSRLILDVGSTPLNGINSSCGKDWEDPSTLLSTKKTFSRPIHILDNGKTLAYIWGCEFLAIFGLP